MKEPKKDGGRKLRKKQSMNGGKQKGENKYYFWGKQINVIAFPKENHFLGDKKMNSPDSLVKNTKTVPMNEVSRF